MNLPLPHHPAGVATFLIEMWFHHGANSVTPACAGLGHAHMAGRGTPIEVDNLRTDENGEPIGDTAHIRFEIVNDKNE